MTSFLGMEVEEADKVSNVVSVLLLVQRCFLEYFLEHLGLHTGVSTIPTTISCTLAHLSTTSSSSLLRIAAATLLRIASCSSLFSGSGFQGGK